MTIENDPNPNPITETDPPVIVDPPVEIDPLVDPAKDVVTRAAHDRLMRDHKATKQKLQEIEARNRADEEKRLRDTKNFELLSEKYKSERDAALEAKNSMTTAVVQDKKFAAVKGAAVRAGLIAQAEGDLEMLDLADVTIEQTNTGRITVLGAEAFVQRLKAMRPHWFGKPGLNLNPNQPGVIPIQSSSITPQKLLQLSKKAQETGDYAEYDAANKAYTLAQQGRRQ